MVWIQRMVTRKSKHPLNHRTIRDLPKGGIACGIPTGTRHTGMTVGCNRMTGDGPQLGEPMLSSQVGHIPMATQGSHGMVDHRGTLME